MNAEQFVEVLVQAAHQPSVRVEELVTPTGRRPPKSVVDLHAWVESLSPGDRARLGQMLEIAVHSALFGALCVLDGVRPIHGRAGPIEFEVNARDGGDSQRLTNPDGEYLHDIYQAMVYARVYGEP